MDNQNSLILDTNIIQYSISRTSSKAFLDYLSELIKQNNFTIKISEYSRFEALRGIEYQDEDEILKNIESLDRLAVTAENLNAAARLESLYKMEKIECNKISDGDKIIAALSVLTNSYIITSNGRDFPWPYFKEIERKVIIYEEKNYSKCIMVAILYPDFDLIVKRFNERIKK